ncbi:MAG: FAD:protein FMN transferase [Bacteroidales bacterium]|nr:FAD:protein FMN transferase [Bacteroidales bacterium]
MNKRILKNGLSIGFVAVCLLCLCACGAKQEEMQKMGGVTQGSYYALSYYTDKPGLSACELQPRIDSLLEAFDLCASLWNENSEICRVNRNEDFYVSDMFEDMFAKAQHISALTDGVFDITVGPLTRAYGFGSQSGGRTLTDAERTEILSYVGWRKVRIEEGKVKKDRPELQLDFNAIAQGYCADITARFLEGLGITRYLVDIGGEICGKGLKQNGQPWTVGIERPAPEADAERTILSRLTLLNRALVTSGNYRKYFEENGQRYAHTISPQSGKPVQHSLLSATVLCEDCWEADAIATACMVMGKEKATAFAARYPERYQIFLIYTDTLSQDGSAPLLSWHTPGFPLVE